MRFPLPKVNNPSWAACPRGRTRRTTRATAAPAASKVDRNRLERRQSTFGLLRVAAPRASPRPSTPGGQKLDLSSFFFETCRLRPKVAGRQLVGGGAHARDLTHHSARRKTGLDFVRTHPQLVPARQHVDAAGRRTARSALVKKSHDPKTAHPGGWGPGPAVRRGAARARAGGAAGRRDRALGRARAPASRDGS